MLTTSLPLKLFSGCRLVLNGWLVHLFADVRSAQWIPFATAALTVPMMATMCARTSATSTVRILRSCMITWPPMMVVRTSRGLAA